MKEKQPRERWERVDEDTFMNHLGQIQQMLLNGIKDSNSALENINQTLDSIEQARGNNKRFKFFISEDGQYRVTVFNKKWGF